MKKQKKAIDPHNITTEIDCSVMAKQSVPIYLGWGNLSGGGSDHYFDIARTQSPTLYHDRKNGCFYHPQYLMGRGRNKPQSLAHLRKFCNNPSLIIPAYSLNAKKIEEQVCQRLSQNLFIHQNEKDFFRFDVMNTDYQFTITHTGKGYIGIRSQQKNVDYLLPRFNNLKTFLSTEGYDVNNTCWLAVKTFKSFGFTTNEVSDAIIDEIRNIILYMLK